MKINKKQLITLLSDRTGMDQTEVDKQFRELVGHIRQAEKNHSTFCMDGFGTFKVVQDRLEFIPAAVFETEINNRYAGMKPIELIGAYKEPHAEEKPVAVSSLKDESAPPLPAVPENNGKERAAEERLTVDSDHESTQQKEAEPLDKPDPKEKEKKAVPPTATAAPSGPAPGVSKQDKEKPVTTRTMERSQSSDPIGRAILIIMAVLLLAAGSWFAYDIGFLGGEQDGSRPSVPEAASQQQSENAPPAGETNAGSASEQKGSVGEDRNTQSEATRNETSPPSGENQPYGLYGELNEDLNRGYFTIIVHSLRTMQLAEEKAGNLEGNNFRIKIKETTINGQTYYRVGIGQFRTVRAAEEAISKLQEPLKSNNFISRF